MKCSGFPMTKKTMLRSSLMLAGIFAAALPLLADGLPILAALKGPSGIGLAQLYETPPRLADGRLVQMVAVPSADIMAAKVIGGEYQVAVLPINMAAKLRSAGVPLVLGAIIGNGMLSLLTNDPGVTSLADLRGSELDVAGQGATPDFLMRRLLRDARLDPDADLHLAYALPYPEMAAALAAGKIHNAVLPEPFSTIARMANPALRSPIDLGALWKASTGMADYPMTALVFRTDAGLSPADIRGILDAVHASIDATIRDPVAAGLLVEKHELGVKAALATVSIPRCNFTYQEAPAARPQVEALLSEFLKAAPASIGGKLPEATFYARFK